MAEQTEHINVTTRSARRLTFPRAGECRLESVSVPPLTATTVIIKTLYSAISRGTEALVFNGQVPRSQWHRMRCPHMAGDFSFPVSYGYAAVGKVIEIGSAVSDLQIGDHVFALHPHQDEFQIEADHCVKIPDTVPADRAVLAANMETGLNAVWDANLEHLDNPKTTIIGAGVVGFLTAYAIRRTSDVDPILMDVDAGRKHIAERLGFEFQQSDAMSVPETAGSDLVFHTSGTASGLQAAIEIANFEGQIIEMSWYGNKRVELDLGGAFHSQRLRILSSQVGAIAPGKRQTFSHKERLQEALAMLTQPELDCLIEPEIAFASLPDHISDVLGPSSRKLCQLVTYR